MEAGKYYLLDMVTGNVASGPHQSAQEAESVRRRCNIGGDLVTGECYIHTRDDGRRVYRMRPSNSRKL